MSNTGLLVRLIVFVCFLLGCIWSATQAAELNSAAFAWLCFAFLVASGFSAIEIFDKTKT